MIDCFIPYAHLPILSDTVAQLRACPLVSSIYVCVPTADTPLPDEVTAIEVTSLYTTHALRQIARASTAPYLLLYTQSQRLSLGYLAIERLLTVTQDTAAGMVYADRYTRQGGVLEAHPAIGYQLGSLRDDFDFGPLLLFRAESFRQSVREMIDLRHAALYHLRLHLSRIAPIVHVSEYLYTEVEEDLRTSGEKQFDYVDPRNRERQLEMEAVCTAHLKAIGAYLPPTLYAPVDLDDANFPYEASVIIPVRNRVRTICDAIDSVLRQQTSFPFNIIVIDNHSDDGTTQAISRYTDPRVIHLIPQPTDLEIGGCWNVGIHHQQCGKFAVQLDSDDVYSGSDTLQQVIDAFYRTRCAMVIGTYLMTDFTLREIPPGMIDHREWSDENGRNNALRINGLGAPRAFFTPLLRAVNVPNTSYGEDYALGLYFTRNYHIGRIYDVIYLCRRWDDNSDASLDITRVNRYNHYKDSLRTQEIMARTHLLARINPV